LRVTVTRNNSVTASDEMLVVQPVNSHFSDSHTHNPPIVVRFPAKVNLFLLQHNQTSSAVRPVSFQMGTARSPNVLKANTLIYRVPQLLTGAAKLNIYFHFVPEDNFTLGSFSISPYILRYLNLKSNTGLLRPTQVPHKIHHHLKFSRVIFEKLPSMMRLHSKCLYVPPYTTSQVRKEPHYAT